MENKSNSKNIVIAVLITLLICVIGFCIYLIVSDSNKVNNDNNGEINNNENVKKEEGSNDNLVKSDVLNKLNVVLGFNCSNTNVFTSNNKSVNMYWKELCDSNVTTRVFKSELTSDDKIEMALSNIKGTLAGNYESYNKTINGDGVTSDIKNKMVNYYNGMVDYGESNFPTEIYKITVDEVKNEYNRLFNEDISEDALNNFINSVNNYEIRLTNGTLHSIMYIYSEQYKTFYKVAGIGGGVGPIRYIFYVNNIENNDSEVNVYVNAGLLSLDSNAGYKPIISYNITEDATVDLPYSNNNDDASQYITDYKIDESNYKDFTNYRFVFKKNSEGNYYFDKVEKVK